MAVRGGAHRNHDFPQIPKTAGNVHEPYENLLEKMPKKNEKQKKVIIMTEIAVEKVNCWLLSLKKEFNPKAVIRLLRSISKLFECFKRLVFKYFL